jgi:hypothetical protein
MRPLPWTFRTKVGARTLRTDGRLIAGSGDLVRDWALAGHGLAFKFNLGRRGGYRREPPSTASPISPRLRQTSMLSIQRDISYRRECVSS